MKKLYFLLFTFLMTAVSFGQTTIFTESFETNANGVTYTTSTPEFSDGSGDFFGRTNLNTTAEDANDLIVGSFYNITGQDGNFCFAGMDLDNANTSGSNGLRTQSLFFDDIDISSFSNLTFAILLAEDQPSDTNFDWDGGDLFYVEVDYDNSGSFTKILQFATTATSGSNVSAPMLDTDLDGIGDGASLTDVFAEFNVPMSTGNLVDIRIVFEDLGAGDEDIAIDNIRIIDGFVALPNISITSPADATVFAPGTTNVDLEWTTTNLVGGETVSVTIDATTINNQTSPTSIPTFDGDNVTVTVELLDATSSVLDSDVISFSVASLITVADIAGLRADVSANGLGSFYEITGSSLVTHTDGFRNRKWIQDSNVSGVLIYDETGVITTTYNVGDLVSGLRGTTEESNGILRFIPTSDAGTIDSSGNPVTPQVVTITALNSAPDDYESELIQVDNVTFAEGDGTATFATGTNYTLTDSGMNNLVKRTDFFGADYIGTVIPNTQLNNVIGVAGEFNGTSQIYVRDLTDLVLSNENFNTKKFSIFPNPTNTGSVTISSVSSTSIDVAVFDILGKRVKNETISNNRLDVSNLKPGVYLLRLTQDNATSTKKLVIR